MQYKLLLFILSVFIVFQSCDYGLSGDPNENIPPTTSLTVKEINLPDGERLVSQVNIQWWGDDADGFVIGYEIYIGEDYDQPDAEWIFTTSTDSTIVLPIEEGEQNADVRFTVRAIDNLGAVDPDPPSLVFPITNSPPDIQFINTELPPDTTFRIASFGFSATDPDGSANLNRIEIALNDTIDDLSWIELSQDINFISLRVSDTSIEPRADIFVGKATLSTGIFFESVLLNNENTLYVRVFDNAGAVSEIRSHTWFVKEQTSRILFLNDYHGSNSASREALHLELLSQIGLDQIDYLNISDRPALPGGQRVQLSAAFPNRALANPTINMMLAEWDHIYWLSNDLNRNIGYALEITNMFFVNGGTMFINIPTRFIQDDNPLLQFLPFEKVQPVPSGQTSFILQSGSELSAVEALDNVPYLRIRSNITDINPVVPFGGSKSILNAPFKVRNFQAQVSEYDGPKLVSALSPDESILFMGIGLHLFTQENETNPSDLQGLLQLFLIETLGFQQ